MSMRAGIAADAAAALLFRVLSQPALLFPPLRQVEGIDVQHEPLGGYISSYSKQVLVIESLISLSFQNLCSFVYNYLYLVCFNELKFFPTKSYT